ncbi:MAG: cell division protein ZapA [Polyangiales bacterium]
MSRSGGGERSNTVAVRVGGQAYQLRSNVPEVELRRLAEVVDTRIRDLVPPGRPVPATAIVLAAIALVHDLETERAARLDDRAATRERVHGLLGRVDKALGTRGSD